MPNPNSARLERLTSLTYRHAEAIVEDLSDAVSPSMKDFALFSIFGGLTAWSEFCVDQSREDSISMIENTSHSNKSLMALMFNAADTVGLSINGHGGPDLFPCAASSFMKVLSIPADAIIQLKVSRHLVRFIKDYVVTPGST